MVHPSSIAPRKRGLRLVDDDDALDVPAAILCAFCGHADCAGCGPGEGLEEGSGVLAVVPWERPESGGAWSRMWATSDATTHGADAFFASLPDGEVGPALRFAVLAELLAVTGMVFTALSVFAAALPQLAHAIVVDAGLRGAAARWVAIGVPALALWMVGAHALHGAVVDRAATRAGGRSQPRRALRFGLYACGWDLMTGPLGAARVLVTEGVRAVFSRMAASFTAPGRGTTAYLSGCYALPAAALVAARRHGYRSTIALLVLGAVVVLVAVVAALLAR